jgi:hypothetical protein
MRAIAQGLRPEEYEDSRVLTSGTLLVTDPCHADRTDGFVIPMDARAPGRGP